LNTVIETIIQDVGLTVTRRDDGILVYRIRDMRRPTVDATFAALHRFDIEATTQGYFLKRLIDVRGAGWPTPYALAKLIEVTNKTPDELREAVAVLTADSVAMRLIDLTLRKMPAQAKQVTRIFGTEERALAWLHSQPASTA
jgi:hypothetical protein